MDFSLKQALGLIVAIVVCGLILFSFGNFLSASGNSMFAQTIQDESFFKSEINEEIKNKNGPKLLVDDIHLDVNSDFSINDLIRFAHATDDIDGDISSSIKVFGNVDITIPGTYQVKFTVTNSLGLKTSYIKNVLVD